MKALCSGVSARLLLAGAVLAVSACGAGGPANPDAAPDASPTPPATADFTRDILSTSLTVDVATLGATARITLAASDSEGASFEIGDLEIDTVRALDHELNFIDRGDTLDVGVPRTTETIELLVVYRYARHTNFDGASDNFTFTWPYFCGNLFPCHSDPDDGLRFELELTGVANDRVAVYPSVIVADAPSYMLAWAIGAYVETPLGTTTNGTSVSVWHTTAQSTSATNGTVNLLGAFDWMEQTIGAYTFGNKVGSVGVSWGPGAYGGMEHHPMWHVASTDLSVQDTHVHEAAHGWFGDGVRIACWEDLVLSEGTTTYLSGRALDVVDPDAGAEAWASNALQLSLVPDSDEVWRPDTCNEVDVIADNLWNGAVYYRGAYFYRAVALTVGAEALDDALATFYETYVGRSARMSDMLTSIKDVTGYDATACAQTWLQGPVPEIGPCPGA